MQKVSDNELKNLYAIMCLIVGCWLVLMGLVNEQMNEQNIIRLYYQTQFQCLKCKLHMCNFISF